MKHKITVFVDGKSPIEINVLKTETIGNILKRLGIKRKVETWLSKTKDRPSFYCGPGMDLQEDKYNVLWIGFIPTGSRPKYFYKWIGNEKKEVKHSVMFKEFSKYARHHSVGSNSFYSIHGIEARSPGELFKLWCKVKDVIIIKD